MMINLYYEIVKEILRGIYYKNNTAHIIITISIIKVNELGKDYRLLCFGVYYKYIIGYNAKMPNKKVIHRHNIN